MPIKEYQENVQKTMTFTRSNIMHYFAILSSLDIVQVLS